MLFTYIREEGVSEGAHGGASVHGTCRQGPVGSLVSRWIGLSGGVDRECSAVTYAAASQRYQQFRVEVTGLA